MREWFGEGLVIYLQYAICAYNFSLLVALFSGFGNLFLLAMEFNLALWMCSITGHNSSCQFDLRKTRRGNMCLINQVLICHPMLWPLLATVVVWLNLQSQNLETNKWILFCLWKENSWVLKTDIFNSGNKMWP